MSEQAGMPEGMTALSHVMLFVNDLGRAVRWHTTVLGCSTRFVIPGTYASPELQPLGLRIDLKPTETFGKDVGVGPMPYFRVRDVETVLAALGGRGVRLSEVMQVGPSPRFATFWDSEGNALGLEEG